jgi:hypothetical protein
MFRIVQLLTGLVVAGKATTLDSAGDAGGARHLTFFAEWWLLTVTLVPHLFMGQLLACMFSRLSWARCGRRRCSKGRDWRAVTLEVLSQH